MTNGWLTIGIEEEFQIIDADGNLRAHINQLLGRTQSSSLAEVVKAEMMQSVVEIATKVCSSIDEARDEILRLRGSLAALLAEADLRLGSAGTHPFAEARAQLITEHERYKMLEEELQDVIRELLIFGMHVHVGIPNPNLRIEVLNEARYFLPHLLALSTSSPFWQGRDTGLKSYREVIWSSFPRTGIPPDFPSWDDFENYLDLLVKTNCIDDGKKIWWDLRPHAFYPTLEFRICDAATRVEETVCLAALIQAVCAKLLKLREENLGFRKYMPNLIAENRWRAMRHGIEGKLIDFGKQAEVPLRDLAMELLEFVDDVVDELGSRPAVEYVHTILAEGSSADRQLKVFAATGDLTKVVDHICEETVAAPTGV